MATGMLGADPAELGAPGDRFQVRSERVAASGRIVLAEVAALLWVGPDADHFRQDVESSLIPLIDDLAGLLEA